MRFIVIILFFLISFYSLAVNAGVNDKELRIPLYASIITLDPGGVQDSQSLFVSRQVNCQLIRNQESTYKLEAAESIKYISPLQIILKINSSARFHDGSPIKSADIVASFDYIKRHRNVFRSLFEFVEKINIVDDATIVFILRKPSPQFFKILSSDNYAIYKKSFLEKAEKNKNLWQYPLGCGGYEVSDFTADYIRLSPVSKGLPIIFDLNKVKGVNADELKHYDIVSDVIGKSAELNKVNVIEILDPVQYFIGLNTKSEAWKKPSDRCKFLSKLKSKELISSYDGAAVTANDFLPKGTIGYNPSEDFNGKLTDYSTEESKTTSTLNEKLKSFCVAYLTVSVQEKSKNYYLNMIKEIYPNAFMKPIKNVEKFGRNFYLSNCDAFIFALWSTYLDGYEYLTLFEENDANFSGVYDKKLIAKIAESQGVASVKDRSIMYQEIIKEIKNICVVKTLFTIPTKKLYVRNNLKTPGIGLGAFAHYYLGNITR